MNNHVAVLIPWRESDTRRSANHDWCVERWRAIFPDAQVCSGVSPDGPFNRSAAVNDARKKIMTDANVLIVADADTHGDPNAIIAAVRLAGSNPNAPWVLPYNRYYNLTDACSEILLFEGPKADISEARLTFEHRIPSPPVPPYNDPVSGILVLPTQAFDLVGGFDTGYVGWGYEDKDFAARLDNDWGPHERLDSFVFHLWHPVAVDPFSTPEAKLNAERWKNAL